jgi:hypothetical protein
MGSDREATRVKVDAGSGTFWVMGWLFTIAFAELGFGKAVFAIILWPYYLGVVLR